MSVLAVAGVPPVAELAEMEVARVSIGGGFAYTALSALIDAAEEFRDQGTYGFGAASRRGVKAVRTAFGA